jgi:hypothetical protein
MRRVARSRVVVFTFELDALPDCVDGFFEAFWRRPEALLDPEVRASQSTWTLLEPGVERRIVDRLRKDLASGAWDAHHGHLRDLTSYDGALRLVIAESA